MTSEFELDIRRRNQTQAARSACVVGVDAEMTEQLISEGFGVLRP